MYNEETAPIAQQQNTPRYSCLSATVTAAVAAKERPLGEDMLFRWLVCKWSTDSGWQDSA